MGMTNKKPIIVYSELTDEIYILDTKDKYRVTDQVMSAVVATKRAIPKADYEQRLKADMVAMLTDMHLEFEENTVRWYVGRVDGKSDDVVLMETINDIIQQKINTLKGENETC